MILAFPNANIATSSNHSLIVAECFLMFLRCFAGQHRLTMSEAEDVYLKKKKRSFCRMWCEMWFILARSSESYRATGQYEISGYKSDISYLKTSRAFDVLIHSGKPNSTL